MPRSQPEMGCAMGVIDLRKPVHQDPRDNPRAGCHRGVRLRRDSGQRDLLCSAPRPTQYQASAEAYLRGIVEAGQAPLAYRVLLDSPRWERLANEGARPQRLMWANTSTKNPDASDVLNVEALAAPLTVNTMPEKTLLAFADHGRVGTGMATDGTDAAHTLTAFQAVGIDRHALADQLQHDGADSFDTSWRISPASTSSSPATASDHPSTLRSPGGAAAVDHQTRATVSNVHVPETEEKTDELLRRARR